jgi:hypothetical protein
MFLFASGMSLVFFDEKRRKKELPGYLLDLAERTGALMLVWIFLSPFSAGGAFGMDEIALSAMLFLASLLLMMLSEASVIIAAIAIPVAYLALMQMNMLPDFSLSYLGGFVAAPFYLPVMLAGVVAARRMDRISALLLASLALALVLAMLVAPYKTVASPSFMALSVSVSLAGFWLCRRFRNTWLEYLGRQPLRYWVLMYLVLIIPFELTAFAAGMELPLALGWPAAIVLAVACVPFLFLVSKAMDWAMERLCLLRPQWVR